MKRAPFASKSPRRIRRGAALGLPLAGLVATLTAAACSSSKATAPRVVPCAQNSDCDPGLICTLGFLCRPQCKTSADCGTGGSCVTDDMSHAVCRLPSENSKACDVESMCPAPLYCASDYRCRNACMTASDCNVGGSSGRVCAPDLNGANYCANPPEVTSAGVLDVAPPALADGGIPSTPAPPVDAGAGMEGGSALNDANAATGNKGEASSASSDSGAADGPPNDSASANPDAPMFVPNPAAGVLGFTPSNFDPGTLGGDAGIWAGAPDSTNGLPYPTATIAMNDANATQADLYVLHSLVIDATSSVTISGPRPAILAVRTTVDIQGKLWITAGGFSSGAAPGPGGGTSASNNVGGGASYCGVGGRGGSNSPPGPAGGSTYGSPTITPLLGGSAGGGGCSTSVGGGALQIVAGTNIFVRQYGAISAGGGGAGCYGFGGGSGGSILLEAPSITIAGSLAANGGGGSLINTAGGASGSPDGQPAPGSGGIAGAGSAGMSINGGDGGFSSMQNNYGGGGGGAGRIRIDTAGGNATIKATAIISPDPNTTPPCATQGTLN